MALPTELSLSNHFTNLIGRTVNFTRTSNQNEAITRPIFGIYKSLPEESLFIVKADLSVFGSFAGALVGLPDSEVRRRLAATEIDETLKDAISEVFNVASAAISAKGRTVFEGMTTNPSSMSPEAKVMVSKPPHKLVFDVKIGDYQGGKFAVLF